MHVRTLVPAAAAVLLLAGCASDSGIGAFQPGDISSPAGAPVHVSVELRDPEGSALGTAALTDQGAGVQVDLSVHGMSAGLHDVSLESVGRCPAAAPAPSTPAGSGAGQQVGDLPPLQVTDSGVGTLSTLVGSVDLGSLLSGDGTAVVIEPGAAGAGASGTPTGQAAAPSTGGPTGSRAACGVIGG